MTLGTTVYPAGVQTASGIVDPTKAYVDIDAGGAVKTRAPIANLTSAKPNVPSGATITVTPAMNGSTILLNAATGVTATLPAATGSGAKYRFVVSTTVSSNADKILAASSSDNLIGQAIGQNGNTPKQFSAASASGFHSIQMPFAGTQPSGGFEGDWFDFEDVAANTWLVKAMYQAGTTPTTPFSTATS